MNTCYSGDYDYCSLSPESLESKIVSNILPPKDWLESLFKLAPPSEELEPKVLSVLSLGSLTPPPLLSVETVPLEVSRGKGFESLICEIRSGNYRG